MLSAMLASVDEFAPEMIMEQECQSGLLLEFAF